ncbi:STM3941 family protein [Anditalea andensis]|uniref:Uncharacterized protein n=1 Tax=Anditalea andensis TaxID=1048983 RepID=A0A074LIC4_9BACT|nr:STM3941 family protein [Anditalea andensis]KEO73527.1 hypothetical protein EL17_11525 [Anditalea andensis]
MVNSQNKIIVPFSRPKLTKLIGIGLVFVVVGLGLIFYADNWPENVPRWIPVVLGIFALLVFGYISMAILKKLTNKMPGLIIREDGIWDNSSAIAIGLIEWQDITKVDECHAVGQDFICIHVDDPQKYIKKAKNAFQERILTINHQTHASAIQITANGLQGTHQDVLGLLQENFIKYKRIENRIEKGEL